MRKKKQWVYIVETRMNPVCQLWATDLQQRATELL